MKVILACHLASVILSASTTFWMPVLPQHLLDFLQNEKTRSHWDVLSQDGPMLRIPKGQDLDNSICILQTSTPSDASQSNVQRADLARNLWRLLGIPHSSCRRSATNGSPADDGHGEVAHRSDASKRGFSSTDVWV